MHMKGGIEAIRSLRSSMENGKSFTLEEAEALFDVIRKERDVEELKALLAAWREKGYSVEEIAACAGVLRREVKRVECSHEIFIDVVGTGGSRAKTFNVSTAAAFAASGAGLPVAKHGNRAASSRTGSADALGELGLTLQGDADAAARSLNEHGICFMFAPLYHNLTKELAIARRELGGPTVFNLLGPIANPAGAPHQLIGIWDGSLSEAYGRSLGLLGTKRSWIVHGRDGLDEITLGGPTEVTEVTESSVERFEISPSDFGLKEASLYDLAVNTPAESARTVMDVLEGRDRGSARDLVAINAGAALFISGRVKSLKEGREKAEESIGNGSALAKLRTLIEGSNR